MAAMGMALAPADPAFSNGASPWASTGFCRNQPLRPEDITPLVAAYEDCLRTLKLSDRSDPVTEILAKKIIEIAQTGIRDSARLGRPALEEIRISGPG
jgi:hypothetical protein